MADLAIWTYPGASLITNQQELSQAYNENRAVMICWTETFLMKVRCPNGDGFYLKAGLANVTDLYHRCPKDAAAAAPAAAHLPVPPEQVAICNLDNLEEDPCKGILAKIKGLRLQTCGCSLSGRVQMDLQIVRDARRPVA